METRKQKAQRLQRMNSTIDTVAKGCPTPMKRGKQMFSYNEDAYFNALLNDSSESSETGPNSSSENRKPRGRNGGRNETLSSKGPEKRISALAHHPEENLPRIASALSKIAFDWENWDCIGTGIALARSRETPPPYLSPQAGPLYVPPPHRSRQGPPNLSPPQNTSGKRQQMSRSEVQQLNLKRIQLVTSPSSSEEDEIVAIDLTVTPDTNAPGPSRMVQSSSHIRTPQGPQDLSLKRIGRTNINISSAFTPVKPKTLLRPVVKKLDLRFHQPDILDQQNHIPSQTQTQTQTADQHEMPNQNIQNQRPDCDMTSGRNCEQRPQPPPAPTMLVPPQPRPRARPIPPPNAISRAAAAAMDSNYPEEIATDIQSYYWPIFRSIRHIGYMLNQRPEIQSGTWNPPLREVLQVVGNQHNNLWLPVRIGEEMQWPVITGTRSLANQADNTNNSGIVQANANGNGVGGRAGRG